MSLIRLSLALAIVAAVLSVPYIAESYPQGAPAGFAGDIVDVNSGLQTCAVSGCHSSYGLNSGTGSVSITAPSSASPGETIQIIVTVDNQTPPATGATIRQGFEATVREAPLGGDYAGTLIIQDALHTRTPFGTSSYVTHTETGTSQTSWTFGWTAPSATVQTEYIIFATGNAANGGDLPSQPGDNAAGDYIYATTASITVMPIGSEHSPSAIGLRLGHPSPNPATNRSTITLSLAEPSHVAVRIVDGRGRTVREISTTELAAGDTEVSLPVNGLAPGTYFVVAETPTGAHTEALQVVR